MAFQLHIPLHISEFRSYSAHVTGNIENPLRSEAPEEVPLRNAPLVRVLAQIRFPLVAAIQNLSSIAPFQEAIRGDYPVLKQEQLHSVTLDSSGPSAQVEQIWRFTDIEKAWRVSLAPTFVALETTSYTSRTDFLARLSRVAGALTGNLDPKVIERIGLRYINRIQGVHLDEVAVLIREPLCGVVGTPLENDTRYSISDALFNVAEEQAVLHARWGYLPPNSTIDPGAMEPIDEPSWVLDLDAYTEQGAKRFDVGEITDQAGLFASRCYTVFRWAVTTRFLERFGGGRE